MATLYIGNTMSVSLSGVTGNGAYLNAGAANYTISEADSGNVIVANVSMPYVAASNANYTSNLTVSAGSFSENLFYNLDINFTQAAFTALFREQCAVLYRE